MRKCRQKQTKEQAAEARAGYHELAEQASKIAKKYLAEHKDAPEGVVYGAVAGAACKYHANAKFRVQPFEVICLWWIRHRLLIHKSKQEDNMLSDKIKKKIIELRLSGVTNEKTAEITETSVSTVGRIMREYRDNQQGFVDAGECTEEQRKQLTEEITALTDKPETIPIEPSGEMLAAIESSAKADSADFDIVNELEYMLTNLREMLNTRCGFGNYRIVAASAEDNSAIIKYSTTDGLIEMSIRRCSA